MEKYLLETEIKQQPEVIRQLITLERSNVGQITSEIKGEFDYIIIAARGSSDNAARYAQYLFGTNNRIPVALATPSLFTIYNQPPHLDRALVIGISQSGQSPDIVQVLKEAQLQNRPTIAITNDPDSPIGNVANFVINLHAGEEKAVAATKTYTSSLVCLAMISASLQEETQLMDELTCLPDYMTDVFQMIGDRLEYIQRYRYMEHCAVVGRGFNYATAFEVALKIKELTRTVAEPYSSADFRHGPIAMVREGFPVVVIAPISKVSNDLNSLIQDLRSLKSEILLISDNQDLFRISNLAFPLPSGIPEYLSPMVAVIPGQWFAYLLTVVKGLNPDNPQGIQKITETY